MRTRLYLFVQEKLRAVWQAVLGSLAPGTEGAAARLGPDMSGPTQPPPTMNNPAGGPAQLISSLWTSYGPSILAGGAALISQTAAATLPAAGASGSESTTSGQRIPNNPLNTPPGSIFGGRSSDQTAGRKRLDVELDQLASSPMPVPPANNPAFSTASTSTGSSPNLRERTTSGKFEETKGGDFDGYEVDGDEFVGGFVPQQPNAPSRASWFGWGQGSRKDGYDRLKNE